LVDIPEELLRRSAEARAAATGRPVEDVLAEMVAAIGATDPGGLTAEVAAAEEPEHPTELSEDLLEREAAARARVLGVSADDAVAEMRGEKELDLPPASAPPEPAKPEPGPEIVIEADPEPEAVEESAPAVDSDKPAVPLVGADGEIDYAPAAASLGMPESLLKRSVEAKAKAKDLDPVAVLAEMTGQTVDSVPPPVAAPVEEAPPVAPASAPAAAAVAAPSGELDWAAGASAVGMTEKLFRRSVEAKAKAKGTDVGVVFAEMTGLPAPAAAAAPAAPAVAAPSGELDWAAAASAAGMPEKLFRRSVEAKAKAKGTDVGVAFAEMTGLPVPASAAAAPAAAAPAPTATATAPAAPAAPAATATIPKDVRPQRLLTVVKAKAIQQVKSEPTDKVGTWPHLLLIEFVALLAVTALLIIMSVAIQAPLLEAANANVTPNPSKAPWYFLGLQELLTYFDPQIAGVTVPTIIGLIGFMAIPYIDRNPSNNPTDRKFAIFMYTFFIMGAAALTIIGTLFRGKGFNFSYPWTDGIFFDDLKDWINFE
jgi:stalled ribosome alternative rescue factor ArfA